MAGSRHTLKLRRSRLIGVERKEKRIMKILLIEDDIEISEMLCSYLIAENFEVVCAADGQKACEAFDIGSYSIVLLDLMIPQITGMNVMKYIRQKSTVPIIIISAKDSDSDKTLGLGLGADDYITKPFSMSVLIRKIAAILRRSSQQEDMPHTISYRDLILDLDGYKVYTTAGPIDLTPREFEILRELLTHKGRILTRQNLLQTLWKYEFFGDERIIDTHIKNLRKKLGQADYIETIRGVGYRIDKED